MMLTAASRDLSGSVPFKLGDDAVERRKGLLSQGTFNFPSTPSG